GRSACAARKFSGHEDVHVDQPSLGHGGESSRDAFLGTLAEGCCPDPLPTLLRFIDCHNHTRPRTIRRHGRFRPPSLPWVQVNGGKRGIVLVPGDYVQEMHYSIGRAVHGRSFDGGDSSLVIVSNPKVNGGPGQPGWCRGQRARL